MSRGKFRDARGRITRASIIRRSTPEALRTFLKSRFQGTDSSAHDEWVDQKTMNRAARRNLSRTMRHRGRGYTTSAKTIKPKAYPMRMVGARGFKFKPRRERVNG